MLRLLDNKNNLLATMDSPNSKEGSEILSFVALTSVVYFLEIKGSDAKAEKGNYSLLATRRFLASDSDKRRIELQRIFVEGMSARDTQGQIDIAVKKLEEALNDLRELKDEDLIQFTQQQINRLKKAKADTIYKEATTLFQRQTVENVNKAFEKFQEAVRLYEETESKSEERGLSLGLLGRILNNLGKKKEALTFYNQSLIFFQTNNFKKWEATTLNNIGRVYSDLGENQKALEFFEKALFLLKQIGFKLGEAQTLNNTGLVYSNLGENQKALEFFEKALLLRKEVGDKSGEATTLNNLGTVYSDLGEKQKAFEFYEKALSLIKEVGDKRGEANTLTNLGAVYSALGENQKALESYLKSLSLRKEVGDKRGEANTLNNLGELYSASGESRKALEFYKKALSLRKEVGDKQGEANTLNSLGLIFSGLGEKQKALEFYEKALSLIKEVGDKQGKANTLNNIGLVYSDLGEKQKALEFFEKALSLIKQVGDKSSEATTLNNIGLVYSDIGEKQKALEFYEKVLLLRKEIGDKSGEATTLNNLGSVYLRLGEKQKALEFFEKALLLRKEIGDKQGEATTLNNFGQLYSALGEKQKALEFYQKSLHLTKEVGDKRGEAVTLNNIGLIYSALGEKQKALEFYEKALPQIKQVGDKAGEAKTLNNIGLVYSALGEKHKALEFYLKSLPLRKEVFDKVGEAVTLNNLMTICTSLENPKIGIIYGKQSVTLYQNLRSNIKTLDSSTQKNYLNSVDYTYRYLVEILLEEGRLTEAQQILNLFKDQQFFDVNPNPNEPIKQAVLSNRETLFASQYQQTIDEVGKFSSQLSELKRTIGNRQPTSVESSNLQKLESQLQSATDSFLKVLKDAESVFAKPFDDSDKVAGIPDTQEMQSALKIIHQQTNKKTVAVYTLVGQRNFWALIVSPDSVKAVSSPIKDVELNDKALKLWGILQSDVYDPTVLSKQIYDVVFKSLEKLLPSDTNTIMWSLDGNLRYLPMSALFDGKQFLVERFNHVVFTRADSQRILKSPNPNWSASGFGTSKPHTVKHLGSDIFFSELPGVTQELNDIFKPLNPQNGILNGQVFSDEMFTRNTFLETLKSTRPVVHISSHFAFRPGDEERSFLLLGDGTAFSLNDMKKVTNLFEGVDLLALSACNTAATQQDANGREVDGFAELAQRLGSGAVMATLWSVADNSTPWLMKDFYNLKLNKGENKAEALRNAQLSLLKGKAKINPLVKRADLSPIKIEVVEKKDENPTKTRNSDVIYLDKKDAPVWNKKKRPPFSHPFYWSPFILFGNWK
jgi:tetratricopeptide (TPR) repeat protein/CHAT domain-containing protein